MTSLKITKKVTKMSEVTQPTQSPDPSEGIVDVIESASDGVRAGKSLQESLIAALGSRPAGSITISWLIRALFHRCPSASPDDCRRAAQRLSSIVDLCARVGCHPSACLAVLEEVERRQEKFAVLQDRALTVPQATLRLFIILLPVVMMGEIAAGARPFAFFSTVPGLLCAVCGGLCIVVGSVWISILLHSSQSIASTGQSEGMGVLRAALVGAQKDSVNEGEDITFSERRLESMSYVVQDEKPRLDPSSPLDFLLIASLIRVCLRAGEPLSHALKSIGECGSIPSLSWIGQMLDEGEEWSESWRAALCRFPCTQLRILESALEDSWQLGVSADTRLQRVIHRQEEGLRSQIESVSSRLSIRLLVPVGLCFLPAFILIAVVPSIVSYAGMGS
jgi:hypothetical protein